VRYVDGALVPQQAEVDDARWFAIDEALQLASFARERDVLERVFRMAEAGDLR
jgi:NADH pyrophosphatase NudC (nudix superfamily)